MLFLQQVHLDYFLPQMAPKESKAIDHKTCVNTPPSHNQEGNIINYIAVYVMCVPFGMTMDNSLAVATLCLDGQQMVSKDRPVLPYPYVPPKVKKKNKMAPCIPFSPLDCPIEREAAKLSFGFCSLHNQPHLFLFFLAASSCSNESTQDCSWKVGIGLI